MVPYMGEDTGGGREGPVPANFSAFYIMPMGGAWKESTSNGPRPPNRRAALDLVHLFPSQHPQSVPD